MKTCLPFIFLLSCILSACEKPQPEASQEFDPQQLADEMETSLTTQLFHKWYPLCFDEQYGGFAPSYTRDWQPTEDQSKMIVSQARHTWSNAKAAHIFPEDERYRKGADHGYAFLRDVMWDKEYGGFYTLVDQQGKVINEAKTAYGNSFGLYALSAYVELTGSEEALELAQQSFMWLEEHSYDPEYGGYFPSLERNGDVITSDDSRGFGGFVNSYKDQNTSIHLLEAFSELYKVWPDTLVHNRLAELLALIRDTITTDKGYLTLFLYPDWTPISYKDSSNATREAHFNLDHVSFGHDIETAYLMLEASEVLEKHEWDRTLEVAKRMVDHSINQGWDKLNGGLYDQGYYFNGIEEMTIIDHKKNWWTQAEALNSLLLFSQLYPENKQYQEYFLQQWDLIKTYMIDPQYGEWYSYTTDTWPLAKLGLKGHNWKTSYHNGRALMNCVKLLREGI